MSAHSPKFLIVSVLDTVSLACTDMCKEYILCYVLKGDGGVGGGIKLICRNQRSPVKVVVLKRRPVACVLEVVWNTLSHS